MAAGSELRDILGNIGAGLIDQAILNYPMRIRALEYLRL
jgi:hypothetical protein